MRLVRKYVRKLALWAVGEDLATLRAEIDAVRPRYRSRAEVRASLEATIAADLSERIAKIKAQARADLAVTRKTARKVFLDLHPGVEVVDIARIEILPEQCEVFVTAALERDRASLKVWAVDGSDALWLLREAAFYHHGAGDLAGRIDRVMSRPQALRNGSSIRPSLAVLDQGDHAVVAAAVRAILGDRLEVCRVAANPGHSALFSPAKLVDVRHEGERLIGSRLRPVNGEAIRRAWAKRLQGRDLAKVVVSDRNLSVLQDDACALAEVGARLVRRKRGGADHG